jgi:hypothetical protein
MDHQHDEELLFGGVFRAKLIHVDGTEDEWEDLNLVVNQGLNSILSVYFNGGTQINNWFMGIFQGNYTPQPTDTAANIAANSTECSSYTGGARPQWQPAAPTAQSISNSTNPATYTFNANITIYGAFLISSNVIGGTAGTLFSEALFTSPKSVNSGDQLLLTYTFQASSGP